MPQKSYFMDIFESKLHKSYQNEVANNLNLFQVFKPFSAQVRRFLNVGARETNPKNRVFFLISRNVS